MMQMPDLINIWLCVTICRCNLQIHVMLFKWQELYFTVFTLYCVTEHPELLNAQKEKDEQLLARLKGVTVVTEKITVSQPNILIFYINTLSAKDGDLRLLFQRPTIACQ